MSEVKESRAKRKYDGSGRRARAEDTRRRVIDAAGELFVAHGYAGTSIRAIALRAGVSQETVYAGFGSKAVLLSRWVDVQVVGDDAPVALIDRAWVRELREQPDREERFRAFSDHGMAVTRRVAPAMRLLRAAAQSDPDIAEVLERGLRARLHDIGTLFDLIFDNSFGPLPGDRDESVTWLWAITGDEIYTDLTMTLGWTHEQYVRWMDHTVRSTFDLR